jgi:glycosyltransferase involved in cell wall biosynthesis
MKIGFFTSIEGWGGSESYLLSLMQGVREAGHVPVLFGINGARLFREASEAGIECIAWKALSHDATGAKSAVETAATTVGKDRESAAFLRWIPDGVKLLAGNVREVIQLRQIFRSHPVDVMHVNISGYEVAGIACRLCGIPSVGWHCIMPGPLPWSLRRWIYWWSGRMYTVVGGMSLACVEAWRQWCGLPRAKCRPVWNGIPLEKFVTLTPMKRRVDEPFVALAVGRLHPMKGFDLLIQAFGVLHDPRLKLVIAGEGSSETELRKLAGEQPNGNNIEFAGHREDMEVLYQKAHCMILPSVSHESFGLVLAEAMASGLPLITSDYGPLPEINVEDETGLIVPARNVESLAAAIIRLMDNPPFCFCCGVAGRIRAQACFSRQAMIDKMIALYGEVTM